MRQRTLALVIPVAAMLASACGGGGGGGGGGGSGVTITRTNAERVAESAVSATAALNGLAFLNQDVLNGIVGASAARLASGPGRGERATARLLARVPRSAALLSGEVTVDCDPGTATIQVKDLPPLDLLSPGDEGSIHYDECVLAGTTLGGTVSFEVIQNDNFPATPFQLEIAYTIGNLSASEPGFSGSPPTPRCASCAMGSARTSCARHFVPCSVGSSAARPWSPSPSSTATTS